jgi:hypothetical protein
MIILNETKIKYDHLDVLLEDKLIDIRFGNDVNVIIDLKEVIRKFFRPNILPEGAGGRSIIEEISSDIINIIGHYRNYFYKKGKYTSFFFLYSKSECEIMKQKYPEYKKDYYQKYFHSTEEAQKISIIRKVVEILDKIVNHVPNSSFIDTSEFDEYTVAKFLISKTKQNEINIILSNDEMMAQLLNKNTFMLNIKGIKSKLLDSKNAVSILTEKETSISTNLLPLILSFSGAEKYSLENIDRIGLIKALTMAEKLIASEKLMDSEYVDFPINKNLLFEKDRTEKLILDNFDKIEKNYSIVINSDVLYTNTAGLTVLFNKPRVVHTFSYYTDLNSKIFTSFPLNLEMMLKGETLK